MPPWPTTLVLLWAIGLDATVLGVALLVLGLRLRRLGRRMGGAAGSV